MPDPLLKTAAAEIEAVLVKHDIAGVVLLSSKTHTEYILHVDPSWSCCFVENTDKGRLLRVRSKRADYPSKEAQNAAINDSVSLIMGLYDTARNTTELLGNVAGQIAKHVEFTHFTRDDNPERKTE